MTAPESPASAPTTVSSGPAGVLRRYARWWLPAMPLARVAVLRAIIYPFVILDVLFITNDVIPHGYAPQLYQPTLIGRILPFPTPSVVEGWVLLVVIVVGSSIAATGRLPRIAGWTVAVAFLAWQVNSQGFSYVSHDHLALVTATLVLPTVGRARFTDTGCGQAAGWAVRVIQVMTVATYVGSAVSKWVRNGTPWAWADSAVFTWAIMRRGSGLIRWVLEYPVLLRLAQWILFLAELFSPVVFWLRGKWLAFAICFFLAFHLATFLSLGIHFLPTVVCWAAFAPLERVVPWLRARVRRARPGAPAVGSE